jgi:hypothetical protein
MNRLDRWIDNFIRHVRDTKPKIPIGPDPENPTYWRFFVIPRNRWLNLYLHSWHGDDPQHHHDHRAANISFLLTGPYSEERFIRYPREGLPLPNTKIVNTLKLLPRFRFAATPHRVVLFRDAAGEPKTCWSLFIKFPDTRDWGFWTPTGPLGTAKWIPWQQYTQGDDPTGLGYGQPREEFKA